MRRLSLSVVFILLINLLLSGCQSSTGYYLGAKADKETIVDLTSEKNAQLHWQDLYVTLDFSLARQGDQLRVEGDFSFSEHPKIIKSKVGNLTLKLFWLDEDRLVLGYLDLYRTVGSSLDEQMRFSRSVFITPETVSIAFGYEGKLLGDGDFDGGGETIWKLPKRSYQ